MMKTIALVSAGLGLALVAGAENINGVWSGATLEIGLKTYRDMLSADNYNENKSPTDLKSSDNVIMGKSADVSFSADAALKPNVVFGQQGGRYDMNLNGKTIGKMNLLRTMTRGVDLTISGGGSLSFTSTYWPDRYQTNPLSNNVITVTGTGTTVDFGNLYFGYNMGSPVAPGAGAGNQIYVCDGATAKAKMFYGYYANVSGRPNGFYVSGAGTRYLNNDAARKVNFASANGAESFSNEFVVAAGASLTDVGGFTMGTLTNTMHGIGHLIAFRGASTTHAFDLDSIVGVSQRYEIDGANVTNTGLIVAGNVTVRNQGQLSASPSFDSDSRTLVSGAGAIFRNLRAQGNDAFPFTRNAATTNALFVLENGASLEGIGRFSISGSGNMVVFRGSATDQTLLHPTASACFSAVNFGNTLQIVEGAKLRLRNSDGTPNACNRIRNYGDILVSGTGGLLDFDTTTSTIIGGASAATSTITVEDGATLSLGTGSAGLQIAGDGGTNANVFVRSGGTLTAGGTIVLGSASIDTSKNYTTAPYDCVFEVVGMGSSVTAGGMNIGSYSGAPCAGCCTNGHDNVLRVKDGGRMTLTSDLNVGQTCSSNRLEVLAGGQLTVRDIFVGRAHTGTIMSSPEIKARDVAFDNGCVVTDEGEIGARVFSVRGNNGLCHVTNGVIRASWTNIVETMENTGRLLIAGTNSLVKGDMAFRFSANDAELVFALPRTGYCRAPIQSDRVVFFNNTTRFVFEPPTEAGDLAECYVLAEVPTSGTMNISAQNKTNLQAALDVLKASDPRFERYRVKVIEQDGRRYLVLTAGQGMVLIFK